MRGWYLMDLEDNKIPCGSNDGTESLKKEKA